jgi:bifunctional DNA-binding transcriptional regulator/antitoxin component of YhaV-PrlF toxin-antitoxin module
MSKITSKLQLTVPKAIADQYQIRPGDNVEWVAAGDTIRVIHSKATRQTQEGPTVEERLALFDKATERQREREANPDRGEIPAERAIEPHKIERGWAREDLHTRGRSR